MISGPTFCQSTTLEKTKPSGCSNLSMGGGLTGDLFRSIDWSLTPLGAADSWPDVLKTMLNLVFHSKHPMLIWWGPELIQIYNDAYLHTLDEGRHPRAMGQSARECWAEIWTILGPQVKRVFEQGDSIWHEQQFVPLIRRGRVEETYWSYSYSPIFDSKGSVGGILVVCTETTTSVLAQKKLQHERERLLALLMQLQIPICILEGPNFVFTLANSDYQKIVNREVLGKPLREVFSDDEVNYYLPIIRQVYQNNDSIIIAEAPLNLWDKNGKPENKVIHVCYHPYRDSSGTAIGVIVIIQDVTEQAKAKDEIEKNLEKLREVHDRLEESETLFRKIADSAPVFIWRSRSDQLCDWFSKGWLSFRGRTMEEEIGDGWIEGVHPDDRDRCLRIYNENFSARTEFYMEYRMKDFSGEYRWINDRGVPRFTPGGTFEGFIGASMDIHDRVQAIEKQEESIRIRDEFLSIASHELKTPLTGMKIQTQMFQRILARSGEKALDQEKIVKLISQIDFGLNRLINLVEDMLDISKIQIGKLQFNFDFVDLKTLLEETLQRVGPAIRRAGIELQTDFIQKIILKIDRFRIEQVLTNLITNAIRYASNAPLVVSLQEEPGKAVIRFRDFGPGIRKSDQEKIFQRFERLVSADEISGMGLGLYISRQIIDGHGGRIYVESDIGQGACFVIELPKEC